MAEKQLAKLVVKLEAEIGKYQRDLAKAEKRTEKFRSKVKGSLGGVKTAFAAIGVGLFTKKVVDATAEQEAAIKQLEATWRSTGGAVGISVDQMIKDASRFQSVSIFGDEQIIRAQSLLGTFTNITKENFTKATQAALDLSTKMGTDLKSSVLQLGKALNDPIAGITALTRSGVSFSQEQKDLIKTLVESGRTVDAQRIILAELEKQFGGSAKAARDSFGGSLKALGNAAGDLLEADSLGGVTPAINELTDLLSDPGTKAAAAALTNTLISGFTSAASAVTKTVNVVRFLAEEVAAMIHGPAIDDIPRLSDRIAKVTDEITSAKARLAGERVRGRPILEANLRALREEKELLEAKLALSIPNKPTLLSESDLGGGLKQDIIEPIVPDYAPVISAEEERNKAIEELRERHLKNLFDKETEAMFAAQQFAEANSKDKVKTLLSEGVQITQGAANTNKALFNGNKALALADAAVTLPSAVLKAVARGNGWPWGAAFGALTLANGLARINAIRKAKFGGTSASLAGTGGGAVPTTSVPTRLDDIVGKDGTPDARQPDRTIQVILNGDLLGVDRLDERILQVVSDGTDNNEIRITDSSGRLLIQKT